MALSCPLSQTLGYSHGHTVVNAGRFGATEFHGRGSSEQVLSLLSSEPPVQQQPSDGSCNRLPSSIDYCCARVTLMEEGSRSRS